MLLVTIIFTYDVKKNYSDPSGKPRKKTNIYLISIFIFVLFYPFPAAMILYWTFNNFLSYIQQRIAEKLI